MSDYSPIITYGTKDALSHGDPNKLIKGVQIDGEFTAIATAVATKYDSSTLPAISPTWINPHNFTAGLTVSGGVLTTGSRSTFGRGIALVNYLTSPDSRGNTTSVVADGNFNLTLSSGAYSFEFYLPLTVTTAGGFQFEPNYSGTFSASSYASFGLSGGVAFTSTTRAVNVISQFGNTIAGDWIEVTGSIVTTSGGTFTLFWAQNASNSTATTIGVGGYVSATQMS